MTVPAAWIAFEGGEGCGKSTQARRLAATLGAVATREPGGTRIGGRVRSLLLDPATERLDARAEALLMAADRAQHLAEVVLPALAAGRDVVSDRSVHSSLAYQGVARGLGVEHVRAVNDWALQGHWPHLVLLITVPDHVAEARLGPQRDRFEREGVGFHRRVAEAYLEFAAADPDRWAVVDGTGSVEAVAAEVLAVVRERLGR